MRQFRHFADMFRATFGRLAASIALAVALLASAPAQAQGTAYALNPGDRIQLRVVSWDGIQLAFVQMNELGGEYLIGQDGNVILPMVGPILAAGFTAAEFGEMISTELSVRMALTQPPSASVEIMRYAPFFVLGDVQAPGQHEYQPGLTAIRALALAGGTSRIANTTDGELIAAIRTTGTLRELQIDLVRLRMRAARLTAEAEGADSFEAPAGLRSPEGPESIAAIIAQEKTLFDSRRETLANAVASLDDTRALLQTEIASLEEKLAGQQRQIELVSASVGNLESLVDRGLARSPALMTLQQTLINLESQALDTETGMFRAQQQLTELDRDEEDLVSQRRLEVLRELQATEAEIDRLVTRVGVNREVLLESGVGAVSLGGLDEEAAAVTEFRILRDGPDGPEEIAATATTPILPYDVVEITTRMPTEMDSPSDPEG